MKTSYSKKEAIDILQRALNKKDEGTESSGELITSSDLEKMAAELNISKIQLEHATHEITETREKNRNEMYPEVVTTRRINGKLSDQEIENLFSDLRVEFGRAQTWDGSPIGLHKIGKTWEYNLKDATVLIKGEPNGYQLQVIKPQFFHGNNVETSILAIPTAFILGLLPVAAAFEWVHIYAAVLTAAVIYFFSFSMVKKITNKKRAETVSKLLNITEFAEKKLKEKINDKQIDLDTTFNQASESTNLPHNNRLQS